MFKKNEKSITHRDRDEGAKQALFDAQERSDDPYEQIQFIKNNDQYTHQQKIIGMVDLVQQSHNVHRSHSQVNLTDGHVDYLMRGIGEALSHMQADLPEGVWRKVSSNLESSLEAMVKQRHS